MAFPPSFLDELVARNPIEDVVGHYVTLKRSGSNLFGLCPFHGEKTASFSVAPDKGIYYCFGCHKGGGVINFMMELEGLSYPDAVRNLAARVGMEVPEDEQYQSRYRQQERLWALHKEAARFFHSQLYAPVGKAALEYAFGRGMSKSILTTFGVGYAPDSWDSLVKAMKAKGYTEEELKESGLVTVSQKNGNIFDRFRDRLMFPIIDVRGNVIGFGGRIIKNDPNAAKYLNSPETLIFNKRKNLFGLNLAKKSKAGSLILVEGNIDVVTLHQYGFDNAIASLGTSLTEEQAALMTRYAEQIILIYDGDKAGQNATQRAIPILEKAGLQVKVLQLKDAKDPDEFLKKFGADRFKLLLEESSNRVEYQLNAIAKKYDIREDDQKVKFINEAAEFLSTLSNAVQREVYGHRVAEAARISYSVLEQEIERAKKKAQKKENRRQEQLFLNPATQMKRKKVNNVVYDNVKSGRAEEQVIIALLFDPSLRDLCKELTSEMFSVPLYSKVYQQIIEAANSGNDVVIGTLKDLSKEEMSHLVGAYRNVGATDLKAFQDCINTIREAYQTNLIHQTGSEDDLLAFRNKLRESKGVNR